MWNMYGFGATSFRMVNQHEWNREWWCVCECVVHVWEYESVYYSYIGIILLFIFPFLFDRILWYAWNPGTRPKQIFPFFRPLLQRKNIFFSFAVLSFFHSFCVFAFDFITLKMVTLALLSILLWVHQTDTTYLKIYGLVLNHVCVCASWEKMYDSLTHSSYELYEFLPNVCCMQTVGTTVGWIADADVDDGKRWKINRITTTTNKNNWMKSRKIDLYSRWKCEGKNHIAIVFWLPQMRERGRLCAWHKSASKTCKNFSLGLRD